MSEMLQCSFKLAPAMCFTHIEAKNAAMSFPVRCDSGFDESCYVLQQGDSFSFCSDIMHRVENVAEMIASVLGLSPRRFINPSR
jgi:hypothetical protein